MATSEGLDLHKLYKDEYVTPRKPKLGQTGPARCFALTGAAFTMKFNY